MSRTLSGLIVCGMFVVGCGDSPVKQSVAQRATGTTMQMTTNARFELENYIVGEPFRHQNLTIFPVTSRISNTNDRFITLDEGLKAGTVEIREIGAQAQNASTVLQVSGANDNDDLEMRSEGNDVNSLVVVNNSDKPLYLMPGEVLVGGSQDRTIGEELVIAPDHQPKKIPVFCVEHGRWGAKGALETIEQLNGARFSSVAGSSVALNASETETLDTVAREADQGKFVASVGQLGKSARVAVQADQNQSAVWEKVAHLNSLAGVQPASGAFTANYCDSNMIKRLEPYLENLQSPITKLDQVVGVLVAINGKIESIDVFESTPLFLKVWPKLLKSYSLDAANADANAVDNGKECSRDAALSFFAETLQANVASTDTQNGIGLVKRDGKHVLSFTSHITSPSAGTNGDMNVDAAMRSGMGGGVHFSGFAK